MDAKRSKKEPLRQRAEKLLSKKFKPMPKIQNNDIKALVHELQVHQVELEMQNEELRKAQVEIEESRKKYVELYEFAPVGYFTLNNMGVIVEANLRGASLLGVERELLLNTPFIHFVIPEDWNLFLDFQRKVSHIPRRKSWELRLKRKGNDHLWVGLESVVVEAPDGQFAGVRLALTDIAERKRAEKALADRTVQLERLNRELVALNAELADFTHMASHDLQEPLRTLTAFSDVLRKDLGLSLPERAAQDLGFITDAAKRMQTLIRDLLALSRAGRVPKKREKVSLDECADRALEALAVRVKETGAQVTRDRLPEVWGDSTLLTQLYQNLIGNALKFSGDQPPIIQLTFEERDGDQIFGVKDNGIGIDPKYAQQIFQPFRRLHGRAEYEGSGIGLAICRKIVERHGGKIWVESEPGKGAHFRFTIFHRGTERLGQGIQGTLPSSPG